MPSEIYNPFENTPDGLRLLAFGDIVGPAGLRGLETVLPTVCSLCNPHLVIANGENANGFGMLRTSARRLKKAGVHVITGGNHTFRPAEALELLQNEPHVLRPANLAPSAAPGSGVDEISTAMGTVGIVNLAGQVFMDPANNPFVALDEALQQFREHNVRMVVVDFHAEATAEKIALALHADGRASLVFGTHTHVPTADERILTGGCGAITDIGMCGSPNGIIGMESETILRRHRMGLVGRFTPDVSASRVQGIAAVLDPDTGACSFITRISWDI